MQQESLMYKTWPRLKKNKGGMFGLFILTVAFFLAVFGYLIAPDNSPYADLQTVEIQAKKPGYTQLFLKIPSGQNAYTNWFQHLLNGKPSGYKYIPIKGYRLTNDS